jgi:hypothetical protein
MKSWVSDGDGDTMMMQISNEIDHNNDIAHYI